MKEPRLIEPASQELEKLIAEVKSRLLAEIEIGIRSIYTDLGVYVESDAWQNYRNDLKQQLAYDNGILKDDNGWARNVRLKIFQENREELVKKVNQDLASKVKELEERVKEYESRRYF